MGLGLENPLHILIVLVVLILLFGAERLPEMGRGLGRGLHEFKECSIGHRAETGSSTDARVSAGATTPTMTGGKATPYLNDVGPR